MPISGNAFEIFGIFNLRFFSKRKHKGFSSSNIRYIVVSLAEKFMLTMQFPAP